jgi:hypothetical protein
MPLEISEMAARLSQSGYNTTLNAERKVQMMPTTTHAVSPPLP